MKPRPPRMIPTALVVSGAWVAALGLMALAVIPQVPYTAAYLAGYAKAQADIEADQAPAEPRRVP